MFLLERSTKDRRFATILYWELNHRVINEMPPYSTRCHHLLNLLKSLEIPNFLEEISSQRHFLSLLDGVCHSAKNATTVSAVRCYFIIIIIFTVIYANYRVV